MLKSKYDEFTTIARLAVSKGGEYKEIGDRILKFLKNPQDTDFLIWCVKNNYVQIIEKCAKAGVNLLAKGNNNIYLPDIAKQYGHVEEAEKIKHLMYEQFKITLQLVESIKTGHMHPYMGKKEPNLGFIKCIEEGAIVDWSDRFGTTPLILASEYGREEMVKSLLDLGVDVNKRDVMGATAIMWASYSNSLKILRLLTEAKAEINVADFENGSTTLIWWATNSYDNVQAVKYLIKNGAIHNASIDEKLAKKHKVLDLDRTAYDHAIKKGNFKIAEFLEKYNRKMMRENIDDLLDKKKKDIFGF